MVFPNDCDEEDVVYKAKILEEDQQISSEIKNLISQFNLHDYGQHTQSEIKHERELIIEHKIERCSVENFIDSINELQTIKHIELLCKKYEEALTHIQHDIDSIKSTIQSVEHKKEYIAMRMASEILKDLLTKQKTNDCSVSELKKQFKEQFAISRKDVNQKVDEFDRQNKQKFNNENPKVTDSKFVELMRKFDRFVNDVNNIIKIGATNKKQRSDTNKLKNNNGQLATANISNQANLRIPNISNLYINQKSEANILRSNMVTEQSVKSPQINKRQFEVDISKSSKSSSDKQIVNSTSIKENKKQKLDSVELESKRDNKTQEQRVSVEAAKTIQQSPNDAKRFIENINIPYGRDLSFVDRISSNANHNQHETEDFKKDGIKPLKVSEADTKQCWTCKDSNKSEQINVRTYNR